MSKTIGLTGSIATGKSAVSKMLADKQIPVVDADVAAREVVKKGSEGLAMIEATFGASFLNGNGDLDRAKLGELIFQDETQREKLNQITHPLVRKYMLEKQQEWIAEGAPLIIFDIPLLYESKLTHLVDKVIVVKVDPEVQLQRLMSRNHLSEKDAKLRIASQISISKKAKLADYVIDNNGTLEETEAQLDRILAELR